MLLLIIAERNAFKNLTAPFVVIAKTVLNWTIFQLNLFLLDFVKVRPNLDLFLFFSPIFLLCWMQLLIIAKRIASKNPTGLFVATKLLKLVRSAIVGLTMLNVKKHVVIQGWYYHTFANC